MNKAFAILCLFMLSGCMHFSKKVCPEPYYFSSEEMKKASGEIGLLPRDSALLDMFLKENKNNDYLKGLN